MDAQKAQTVLEALSALYPEARAELHFTNPYETLVATILSAQCTDRRVNQVTEKLFPRYPTVESMAALTPEELEPQIRECGLYRNKAKNIIAACRAIAQEHGGKVPSTRAELMALPGVGQKTAGVVLLAAFGDDQIPVDTHVFRVSHRIGLADATTPDGVEKQLRPSFRGRNGRTRTICSSGTAAAYVTRAARNATAARSRRSFAKTERREWLYL